MIGYDINPFSVFLAHLSLLFGILDTYLESKAENPNYEISPLSVAPRNSLTFGIPSAAEIGEKNEERGAQKEVENIRQVDYVVGNPPFVRNERLPEDDRGVLKELYPDLYVRNTDLSVFFLYVSTKYFVKSGGAVGMVAPVGIANTQMAAYLRETLKLNEFDLYELVSLEWCAKQIFPGADIIPMLVFVRKQSARADHQIRLVRAIAGPEELARCIRDPAFLASKSSELSFNTWSRLSRLGDWCLDVSERDVPIIEKLNALPGFDTAAHCCFAVKSGNKPNFLRSEDGPKLKAYEARFVKGQHVAAFQVSSEVEEYADLKKIDSAEDPSIWRDLKFYEANRGKEDTTGLGRSDYQAPQMLSVGLPSDTLCCLVPEISVTLAAAVADPLTVVANNSVLVVRPQRFSAYCLAAIINSRISRYYSFLTLRSAILLRRRTTWFPRAIKALPFPHLTSTRARRLHDLAFRATEVSATLVRNEEEIYKAGISSITDLTKAAFLGLRTTNPSAKIDRDDLAGISISAGEFVFGHDSVAADSPEILALARAGLLASAKDEFTLRDLEDVLLPSNGEKRKELAEQIEHLALNARRVEQDVLKHLEEIDEIVAAGLGLTPAEHSTIVARCDEFPLSVTVARPRFAWSPDRKRQARRVYEQGERFK